MHALYDWKNAFLRIVDIGIENFSAHPYFHKQRPSRSVKALKRKMEKLHSKYVLSPLDKAANNVIIIWKRCYLDVLKSEFNTTSTYMYQLRWRKTNSTIHLSRSLYLNLRHIDTLKLMSKLINMNCLHFISCKSYTKDRVNHASYHTLVTGLLPFFLSTLHPSNVMI